MRLHIDEISETVRMVQAENLDVRTVTLGIDLHSCVDAQIETLCQNITGKIRYYAKDLKKIADQVAKEYGIPIINKRIAITPIAEIIGKASPEGIVKVARAIDAVAKEVDVDFIGGFSALIHKNLTHADYNWLKALPQVLCQTERICASASIGSTRSGIYMDAIYDLSEAILQMAEMSKDQDSLACAKFVVFCNPVEDNPFMAGAFHGAGEGEVSLSVGVSGPGVVYNALKRHPHADLNEIYDIIKKTSFKITRAGEMIGREVAARLDVPFNIIDLSLAPTNAQNDSVADILEEIGLESVGTHGTIAALAMMNDAVKKGGAMASNAIGGLSGAFIPVSEDNGMIAGIEAGALTLDKLEGMTAVCSVGLDMIAIEGTATADQIAGIIADEAAIGMINRKTTAVRVIPVIGKKVGEMAEFGGLLGRAPIISVKPFSSKRLFERGGRIPAPFQGMTN
ncbi:PFL family protein [Allofustis seminis]|uniref:PFL family protein n=1 Tax=Allofustis seminis TaxID=166939 RepID=UPI00037D047A|nr:PFL family protein [Allofustis seminis]